MTARIVPDDEAGHSAAIDVLRADGIVALPTDTVYGIAVALATAGGVERLFEVKERPPDKAIMVLSDHKGPSLLWIDYKARKIVAETKGLGAQPFHTTYDPLGERILLTTNVDGMVNVIDVNTKQVVQKIPVPTCHGIAAVGIP